MIDLERYFFAIPEIIIESGARVWTSLVFWDPSKRISALNNLQRPLEEYKLNKINKVFSYLLYFTIYIRRYITSVPLLCYCIGMETIELNFWFRTTWWRQSINSRRFVWLAFWLEYLSDRQAESTFPDFTCVVFWSCNYCISFIIECTRKNLVCMSLQWLRTISTVAIPYFCSSIATSRYYSCTLWVECHFGNFAFVSNKYRLACTSFRIEYSSSTVRWCWNNFCPSRVKWDVKDFISVTPKRMDTAPWWNVP